MMSVIKRDDAVYKEIEAFEDYELTQCVAYEMAIRNDNNLNQIKNFIELYNKNEQGIKQNPNFEKYLYDYNHKSMLEKIEILPISKEIIFSEYKDMKRLGKEIYNIMNSLYSYEELEEETTNYDDNIKLTVCRDIETTTLCRTVSKKGFLIETNLLTRSEDCIVPEDDSGEDMTYKDVETLTEFSKYILHNNTNKEHLITGTSITEDFKRPKLNISELENRNATLEIDINKPLDEIIAYVTHIKNSLEDIKAPIELLGVELKKADNLICDTKGKCFDAREILSKQQKLADMFYIYDCLKVKMTQRKIQNEVYNYYADKGIETKTLDAKTLKRYKEIAIDYIDNMRYKELVTGVKLEDF